MQCPLSRRPVDLRGLRVEQVLGTFLRNYFPAAYRAARDEIAVIGHTEAAKASPRPPPPRPPPPPISPPSACSRRLRIP